VTLLAVLAELAVVLVAMAVCTGERVGAVDAPGVAQDAIVLDLVLTVETDQREPRIHIVVEGLGALTAFDVTIGTGLVVVLSLMGVAMRVAAGADSFLVLELALGFVTASAGVAQMLAVEGETELPMVDVGTLERSARCMAADAIGRGAGHRMGRRVTVGARLARRAPGPLLGTSEVTSRAAGPRVSAGKRETEFLMVDSGTLEAAILRVALGTVLREIDDWMTRHVAIGAATRRGASAHLAALVTIDASLLDVFPLELEPGELGMLREPTPQYLPSERLPRLVTGLTFLAQLRTAEAMHVRVTTLAILRLPEVADPPRLEALDVAFGAGELTMMVRQCKPGSVVLEGVAPTDVLPFDDVERTTFVFDVTADASPSAKGRV
jgi:hypothetical protein